MGKEVAIELKNISKHFNDVIANKNVNLTLYKGEILSILGENGSGKTTLMNMLSGIYQPDEGEIFINGEKAFIHAPKDAFNYHIGMVHQHFKLVDVFSAVENISLGISKTVFDVESMSVIVKERLLKSNIVVNDISKFINPKYTEYLPIYVNLVMTKIRNKIIVNFTPFTGTKKKEEVLSIFKSKYEKWGIDVTDIEKFFPKDEYNHFDLLNINGKIFNKHRPKYIKNGFSLNEVSVKVNEICSKYGFEIDLNKKIHNMSVSEKQTVEIVKVLYRNADILILDEPTAVLTPQ